MNKAWSWFEIQSAQNDRFKHFRSLLTAKGIQEHKQFIISSGNICEEFLKKIQNQPGVLNSDYKVLSILAPKNKPPSDEFINSLIKSPDLKNLKFYLIDSILFQDLDPLGTKSYVLHVEFSGIKKMNPQTPPAKDTFDRGHHLVLASGDPKNLGALFRSALAFETKSVVLTEESAHPYLPHSIKSSAGAVFQLPFYKSGKLIETIEFLSSSYPNLKLYSLDLQGDSIQKTKFQKPCLLVLGEERGYPINFPFEKTNRVFIPTQSVESLNVAVAGSLALYELNR